MNKHQQLAEQQRRASFRRSTTIWTAVLALIVIVLLIFRLNSYANPEFYSKAAIGVAVLLLIVRQITRRSKGKAPRAAQPDPKSTLKLD